MELRSLIIFCVAFNCIAVLLGNESSVTHRDDEDDKITVESVDTSFLDPDVEDFVPTHEWQKVLPGQAIPKGLHVRLNMKTGEKEAKLLDERESENTFTHSDSSRLDVLKAAMEEAVNELKQAEDGENMKYWKSGDKEGMANIGKDHFTREELKQAMKKFKANKDDVQDELLKKESAKVKLRTIEELKKDMAMLNMDLKTDLEVLREIHSQYIDADLQRKLALLEDLEFYVHQIDNAVKFVDLGTLELVLADLNNSAVSVKGQAAFVIGSASQSNPKVQVKVVEGGAIQQFIRMLCTEDSSNVINRVLYATSALTRHFPYAQLKFIQLGGMQVLKDVFLERKEEKIKLKIVNFIGDLMHEQTAFKMNMKKNIEEEKQYKMIHLVEHITEQGWCSLIPTLFSLPSHDTREKTLTTVKELLPHCKADLQQQTSVKQTLQSLHEEYRTLAAEEKLLASHGEELYFLKLLDAVTDLRNQLQVKDEL